MTGKKTDLIIFDLDGTLIDSSDDIAWSANQTLMHLGYKECDTDKIKKAIGWGVKTLLSNLMTGASPDGIEEARLVFLDYYEGHRTVMTVPYPGVEETLEYFKELEKKMAIVTNKPVRLSEDILKDLKLSEYFSMVLGGDSLSNRKPHPEPLNRVMSELNIAGDLTVLVGDSAIDCEAGRMAGIYTIGAEYGFRGRDELEGAGCDSIIKEISELKKLLI